MKLYHGSLEYLFHIEAALQAITFIDAKEVTL